MPLNFVFMDESYSPLTRISSLTGLVVPVEAYPSIRSDLYDSLKWAIQPESNIVDSSPELHGSNFLRNKSDDFKLEVFKNIVNVARKYRLRIYRVGYFITRDITACFANDNKLIGTCWFSLLSMMEPLLKTEMIIPVMDGLDSNVVRYFSPMIKRSNEMMSAGPGESLSLHYIHNVLGEVFYADSKYSVFTQVTDLVAYLRGASDLVALGKPLTTYKTQLSEISESIKDCIEWEELVSLILDGEVQGPKEYMRSAYRTYGPITHAFRITPSDSEDIVMPEDPTN